MNRMRDCTQFRAAQRRFVDGREMLSIENTLAVLFAVSGPSKHRKNRAFDRGQRGKLRDGGGLSRAAPEFASTGTGVDIAR
jgi:hypothetical protein